MLMNGNHSDDQGIRCDLAGCVTAHVVAIEPHLPVSTAVTLLRHAGITGISRVTRFENVTLVFLSEMGSNIPGSFFFDNRNYTVKRCYYTTDGASGIVLDDVIMVSDLPSDTELVTLRAAIGNVLNITKIDLRKDKRLALLYYNDTSTGVQRDIIQRLTSITLDRRRPTFSRLRIVWNDVKLKVTDEIGANRFEDNEELRYSLRSLEKFAPWVRHVFVVTNGQLPHWLNVDAAKLTVVTHQEIFTNLSHLPTFSSSAIESHIHRIPGLSERFIYMNDDVMFGKEVWPEDFVLPGGAQKVYLSWPVPSCRDECPTSWVSDGYCDKACNNSDCGWDGGDCLGKSATARDVGGDGRIKDWLRQGENVYCALGCSIGWVSDRYCDQACNVKNCAFDGGDCGDKNDRAMFIIRAHTNISNYTVPNGEAVFAVDLGAVFANSTVFTNATYTRSEAVRAVTLTSRTQMCYVILNGGHNNTAVHLTFTTAYPDGSSKKFQHFRMTALLTSISTDESNLAPASLARLQRPGARIVSDTRPPFVFKELPPELRGPHVQHRSDTARRSGVLVPDDWFRYDLPPALTQTVFTAVEGVRAGLMEKKSLERLVHDIWNTYLKSLEERRQKPQKLSLNSTRSPSMRQVEEFFRTASQNLNHLSASDRSHHERFQNKRKTVNETKRLAVNDNHFSENGADNVIINKMATIADDSRVLPRRRLTSLVSLVLNEESSPMEGYNVEPTPSDVTRKYHSRRLLDSYGDSLRHVNRVYDRHYGYRARHVPGHMPHMLQRSVVYAMQEKFAREWDVTSSHKVRTSSDMQYAFSYFYYLMSEQENSFSVDDMFRELDTDHSGILSDRELRTLAAKLYSLPLSLGDLTGLESILKNCWSSMADEYREKPSVTAQEIYYDTSMPQVTMNLVVTCDPLIDLIGKTFKPKLKYKFETTGEEEIAFKMITANASIVINELDEVRKNPKKFVCLNDNVDHQSANAGLVKSILHDYYESVLPVRSQFELPLHYRNRFLYIEELMALRHQRDRVSMLMYTAVFVFFTVAALLTFFHEEMRLWRRRWLGRRSCLPSWKRSSSGDGGIPLIADVSEVT